VNRSITLHFAADGQNVQVADGSPPAEASRRVEALHPHLQVMEQGLRALESHGELEAAMPALVLMDLRIFFGLRPSPGDLQAPGLGGLFPDDRRSPHPVRRGDFTFLNPAFQLQKLRQSPGIWERSPRE
jgi:hypothetical protein